MKNCRNLFSLITLMFIFTFTGCGATVTQISDSKTIETGDALTLEPSEFFEASKPDTLSEIQFDTTAVDTNTAGTYEVTATYKKDAYTITVQVNEREDAATTNDSESNDTEEVSTAETNASNASEEVTSEDASESMNQQHPELVMTGRVTEDSISDDWIGAVNDATNGWTSDGTDTNFRVLVNLLEAINVNPDDGNDVYDKLQEVMGMFPDEKSLGGLMRNSDHSTNTTTAATDWTVEDISKTMYVQQDCNLREGPSTDFNKIGSLGQNTQVAVTGQTTYNGSLWYRIDNNGSAAYVSSKLLGDSTVSTDVAPADNNGGTDGTGNNGENSLPPDAYEPEREMTPEEEQAAWEEFIRDSGAHEITEEEWRAGQHPIPEGAVIFAP